jgi:hypothetical protein
MVTKPDDRARNKNTRQRPAPPWTIRGKYCRIAVALCDWVNQVIDLAAQLTELLLKSLPFWVR